jgi:septal ring factor EnvC (AmiA/AmiB activator)
MTYLVLALAVSCGVVRASNQDEIRKRQAELQSIRDQVKEFEEKIKEQQKSEHATLELLDTYERKGTLVRRLIGKLRAQEQTFQQRIESTRRTIETLEDQYAFLRDHYAHYVVSVYKAGRVHDIELLLSSRSINQFYIRNAYLRRFSAQRKADADRILETRREVENAQAEAQQQLSEERRLIAEKGAEEDRLASVAEERREVLLQIRKDRKFIQREIQRQLKAAKELEGMISELVEADRAKKEHETEQARKSNLPQPPPVVGTFETRKGSLRWPVSEGMVVAKFGNQRHPTLNTITQNTGIDIAVKAGSPVSVVAEGEVRKIWWLPSYGNLIIINHYGGYRTVYAHLEDITVTEGEKLKEGDVIGSSGDALDGPRLHFEVWKDREKQNPELWLARP